MKKYPEIINDLNFQEEVLFTKYANPNPYFDLDNHDYKTILEDNKVSLIQDNAIYKNALKFDGKKTLVTDNYFTVPYGFEYKMRIIAKALFNNEKRDDVKTYLYAGIINYDDEGKKIYPVNVSVTRDKNNPYANDTFNLEEHKCYLTQDLNQGDTEVHLQGNPDMIYQGSTSHARNLRFYPKDTDFKYISGKGHIYDAWGYSRHIKYYGTGAYNADGVVDNGDGTFKITLSQPYSGTPFKTGDGMLNCRSGGTHPYRLSFREIICNGEWTILESDWIPAIYGVEHQHKTSDNVIRNGTVFNRVMSYVNYRVKDSSGYINANPATTIFGSIEFLKRPI
jgi:hypothetical protein